jgi:hypothetical protein
MRAGDFFPDGVGWKLNVFLAKETIHFQILRSPQRDAGLAMRARHLAAHIPLIKPDMHAAGRTGHLPEAGSLGLAPFQP